jgi:hypothetical protein
VVAGARVRIRVSGCRDEAAPVKLEGARPGGGVIRRWRGGAAGANCRRRMRWRRDESDSMTAMMGHVAGDGGGHAFHE